MQIFIYRYHMTDHLNIKQSCPFNSKHMYLGHCHLLFNSHGHILQFKYILKNAELDLHTFYSSKRHCWYLKFTLISQGYFPLLFPIILYMSSYLIFKRQVTCQQHICMGSTLFLFLCTVLGCSFIPLEITHIKTNI